MRMHWPILQRFIRDGALNHGYMVHASAVLQDGTVDSGSLHLTP